MRTLSLLAVVLALDPQALDPELPEAARLHAERIRATTMLREGMLLHRVWTFDTQGVDGGTWEEFIGLRRMRSVVRIGVLIQPIAIRDQVDGRILFSGLSGRIEELDGGARATVLTEDSIRSDRWLFGGAKVKELGKSDAGTLLRVTPAGGLPADLMIAPTGDLRWADIQEDTKLLHLEYGHWSGDGGGVWAQQVVSSSSDSGHDPAMSVLARSEFVPEQTLPSLVSGVDWHWDGGAQRTELPFVNLVRGHVTIRPEIDGRHELLLLDTGTEVSVFSAELSKSLKMTQFGQFSWETGPITQGSYAQSPPIRVGPATLEPHIVEVVDWRSTYLADAITGLAGIAGAEFLSKVVLIIDYPTSRVELRDSKGFVPQADDVSIPCERRGSFLFVPVALSGRRAWFLVDTGDDGAVTVANIRDQRALVTPAEEDLYDPNGLEGIGQTAGSWPAWGDLTLGPFHWKHVLLDVYDTTNAKGNALFSEGAIGAGFWKHFRMTIDLGGSRLWLKQEVPFGEHEDDCNWGLDVTRFKGALTVRSLQRRGPAAVAGLRVGDTIRSINGLSTDGVSFTNLHPPCNIGERLSFEVVRKGKPSTIAVVAAPIP